MKKTYLLLFSLLVIFLLVGCGTEQDEAGNTDQDETANTDQDEGTNTDSGDVNTENESDENKTDEDVYFKDNEVKLNDLKIKITDTKVIPVGEAGNEYGDKPVFAIWYETTNLSEKDLDPTMGWMAVFEAVQDNNPNAINELDVAGLPDDQFLDTQLETIKQNGTVENAVAYELDDLETPVTLIASQGIMGEELGEQKFEIK